MAVVYPEFWIPFTIAVISKTIGCSICYVVAKFYLRKTLVKTFIQNRIYRGIDLLINRNPWRFSFLFRIIFIPYFLKNYGLALPEKVSFFVFIVTGLVTGFSSSAITIYGAQTVRAVATSDEIGASNIMGICMTSLSVLAIIYVATYTYKIIKDLDREDLNDSASLVHIDLSPMAV